MEHPLDAFYFHAFLRAQTPINNKIYRQGSLSQSLIILVLSSFNFLAFFVNLSNEK